MVAAHTAGQRRVTCNQRDAPPVLFGPGGSAAGPKPGRNGFSDELGGGSKFSLRACLRIAESIPRERDAHKVSRNGFALDLANCGGRGACGERRLQRRFAATPQRLAHTVPQPTS